MRRLVLNDEQVEVVLSADELLPIEDGAGNVIAYVSPSIRKQDVRDIELAITSPERSMEWRTTRQVFEHLRRLGQNQLDGRENARRRLPEDGGSAK
jgi:hypothetical protein